MVNIKRKAFANILLSFLFIGSSIARYFGRWQDCVEMTFMSNVLTGTVLFLGGVFALIAKRDIPHFLYLDCVVLMCSVIAACLIFAPPMLIVGTAIIPHLINPIAIIVYYLKCCDGRNSRVPHVLTVLVFPTIYYVFMVLFGIMGERPVYPQFDPNLISVSNITLVGLAALAGLFVVGVALFYANRFLHSAAEKRNAQKERNANV